MPSPMDECDNILNIDPSKLPDTTLLKRKLDESSEELSLPNKKIAVSIVLNDGTQDVSVTDAAPPQVKLTKAERDALKLEKAKEREMERQRRNLARQQKEEEKLKREEERLKKQAEKCEIKKRRDAEKEEAKKEREKREQEKEEQRRKKEEEIEKKNKAQLRLNSFFSIPKKSESPSKQPVDSVSDYQRYFQPFHVRQDVVVAPRHRFIRDQTARSASVTLIDNVLYHPDPNLSSKVCERLNTLIPVCVSHRAYSRGHVLQYTAKELIALINEDPSSNKPISLVKQLSLKHLHYAEDVRPAYNGTFTRQTKLTPRNPFKRDPEIFAYDYDSEAEWEFEPEEGENLDDDSIGDDEDMESRMGDSGDEEDHAFLDDEDDENANAVKDGGKPGGKRFVAPLVPMIKGVCWEAGRLQDDELLATMRASILLSDDKGNGIEGPLNPLSSEYWAVEMPPPPAPKPDSQTLLKKNDSNGIVEVVKGSSKSKTPFPDSILRDFLKAIHGSTDNQILLVELLKKQFPTATKGGISEKLKEVAFRTGRKDTDHWEIRKEFVSVMEHDSKT